MRRTQMLDLSAALFILPFILSGALLVFTGVAPGAVSDGLAQVFLVVSKNPFLFLISLALTMVGVVLFVRGQGAGDYQESLSAASSLLAFLGGASAILAFLVAAVLSGDLGVAAGLMVEGRFVSVYPLMLFFAALLIRAPIGEALGPRRLVEPLIAFLALPVFFGLAIVANIGITALFVGAVSVLVLFWILERFWDRG